MSEQEKFEHPALDKLYTALQVIEDAEGVIRRVREQLYPIIAELPSLIGDNEDLRDEIFHHLYWFNERVPVMPLKQAFQIKSASHAKKGAIEKIMRNAKLEVTCTGCDQPLYIEVSSRDDLRRQRDSIKRGYRKKCEACQKKEMAVSHGQYEQWQTERIQRLHLLRTMPYLEYLQTPEWQERRKKAMKRAGFRCQVCNAYGVRLNVHHRTYERRGNESDRDLITLCANCHEIFHTSGKLARDGSEG